MIDIGGTMIIPIGCSCISQFQIRKHFKGQPMQGGFFDWNIATPAASADVMAAHLDGSLRGRLEDRSAYHMLSPRRYLANAHFPGLYFWHEPARKILDPANPAAFAEFCAKLRHQVSQTFHPYQRPQLVWSNIQPNLRIVTARVSDDWQAFALTGARLDRLRALADAIFHQPRLHCAVNPEDCEPELLDQPDIHALGLPRSEEYVGPKGHYAPIFAAIAADMA